MKSLKVFAVFVWMAWMMAVAASCVSTGTTPEQKTVLCADAQAALATADAALATPLLGATERQYWLAFRAGAAVAIASYCGGAK